MTVASAAMLVVSAASTAYQIDHSKKAANAAAKTRENLLERRKTDERNVLRENTRRRLENKKRYLSKLRVQQAASGFANSGTQLAVFGEIESRLDEGIDEATSQAFSRINNYDSQIANSRFSNKLSNSASDLQFMTLATNTATSAYTKHKEDVDRYGKDAFSIFK